MMTQQEQQLAKAGDAKEGVPEGLAAPQQDYPSDAELADLHRKNGLVLSGMFQKTLERALYHIIAEFRIDEKSGKVHPPPMYSLNLVRDVAAAYRDFASAQTQFACEISAE